MVIVVPLAVNPIVHAGAIQTVSPEATGPPKSRDSHHVTHTF